MAPIDKWNARTVFITDLQPITWSWHFGSWIEVESVPWIESFDTRPSPKKMEASYASYASDLKNTASVTASPNLAYLPQKVSWSFETPFPLGELHRTVCAISILYTTYPSIYVNLFVLHTFKQTPSPSTTLQQTYKQLTISLIHNQPTWPLRTFTCHAAVVA